MKTCATCGLRHPDDVMTAHHPANCLCGLDICSARASTLQAGCIWARTVSTKGESLGAAQLRLIIEREDAISIAASGHPVQ